MSGDRAFGLTASVKTWRMTSFWRYNLPLTWAEDIVDANIQTPRSETYKENNIPIKHKKLEERIPHSCIKITELESK